MSVCTIVLNPQDSRGMHNVLTFLEAAGVKVDAVNPDHGVIECTGETAMMRALEHARIDGRRLFEYVRIVMTYCAEFPVGHPLDTNGV